MVLLVHGACPERVRASGHSLRPRLLGGWNLDESDAGLIFFGGDAAQTVPIGVTVPTTFVRGELGGYALGAGVTDLTQVGAGSSGIDGGASCDVLVGVVRDFKGINEPGGHPDFEAFSGKDVT